MRKLTAGNISDSLSVVSGQGDAVGESHSREGMTVPADVQATSVSSDEMENSCDDGQFLRNEANLSIVSGPLSVVACEAGVRDGPGVPDQVIPAFVDPEASVPSFEFAEVATTLYFCETKPFRLSSVVRCPWSVVGPSRRRRRLWLTGGRCRRPVGRRRGARRRSGEWRYPIAPRLSRGAHQPEARARVSIDPRLSRGAHQPEASSEGLY